jgi:hypothetical protein
MSNPTQSPQPRCAIEERAARIQQDFMSCLFTALLAAVPAFLQSLVTCLSGGGGGGTGGDEYQPGQRDRCD